MSDRKPVICIGGSPSSGTTLLADLMDAVPGIACPPELDMFCFSSAYEFDREFKRRARSREPLEIKARYAQPQPFFNDKYFHLTGLDAASFDQLIKNASSLAEFASEFTRVFGEHRNMDLSVLAEKTPINVNAASLFCRHFPDGLFVHLVRDGRAVCASLIHRGFTLYEAAMTWIMQTSAGHQAARHTNTIELRFEDLLDKPFHSAARIAGRVGISTSPEEIASRYNSNQYRAGIPRLASWRVPIYSTTFEKSVAAFQGRLSPGNIDWLQSVRLSGGDEAHASREAREFAELLNHYEYQLLPSVSSSGFLHRRLRANMNEFSKKSLNVDRWGDYRLQVVGRQDYSAHATL